MAQRHEVEAWVNPGAWDDEQDAQRVVDAIVESGSDDEAEWVRIASGGRGDVLAAAARDFDRHAEAADAARDALYAAIRDAVAGGMTKSEAHRVTGVSRPTIDKVVGQ